MDTIQSMPISSIKLSQTNSQVERRAHFDKDAIAELADSLGSVGMLAPIIVRPLTDGPKANGFHVELVAGERRYLAAKQAKLSEVPVSVRDLTDEQVLEVQLVENLQREGLHELAEAEGYESLQKLGHNAQEIADKVGKSKAYVYARMKLLALSPAARKAFYSDKISASVALLLARIPVAKIQDEALKAVTTTRWNDEGAMSFREASQLVQREYMLKLSDAGFKTEDATLVPAAGACGPCPKRTGNQRELFGDVKGADVCTDPICFKSKLAAHAARAIEQAEATGRKIIMGTAAKKIFPYHGDSPDSTHAHLLTERNWDDNKQRTYGQLLGKDFEPTLVIHPESGKIVKVATTEQVKATFKEKGVKVSRSSTGGSGDSQHRAAVAKAKVEKKFRSCVYAAIRPKLPNKLGPSDLRALALQFMDRIFHVSAKTLCEIWELDPPKPKYGDPDWQEACQTYLQKLTDKDIPRVLFDMTYVSELEVNHYRLKDGPKMLLASAKKLRINVDAIRKACQPVKKGKKK